MKTRMLISIILVAAFQSCIVEHMRPVVTGSGKVVTEKREAGYFNVVKASTGIDVYLTQGNTESITLEADDNLHKYIKTDITGNTLKVYSDANIRRAKTKRVYVTVKDIVKISVSSAGDVIGENTLHTDELTLSASSAGDIKLSLQVKRLNCDLSSSGDMDLQGTADELHAGLSSAGDLNAYDLKTRIADVSTSSAGNAKIYVTEKLTATASSAGDIYYMGDPEEVDGHASSAGGIHKKQRD